MKRTNWQKILTSATQWEYERTLKAERQLYSDMLDMRVQRTSTP